MLEDLESLSFQPIQVSRMNRHDRPMPLVLTEMPMCKKADIFEVKTLCGLSVKVEKPHKPKDAAQCHRCQRFHHSQRQMRRCSSDQRLREAAQAACQMR
ncbi:hypothetical protein Zmor_014675 [Zophobas morio]|uniref:Pre-C2HC domain-containing protein n=1 Tax=Zophobas morio TaxID=2755281 RepID=A0AA38MGL8_9CUCU|nr:hypothetical protein Zmor_014675 [Zophobas morio]